MADRDQFTPTSSLVPTGWNESAGLRETYLLPFTRPADVAAMKHLAEVLHEMALECARVWPAQAEPAVRAELRAVRLDLQHLQGFLANVAREREVSSLPPPEDVLSRFAATLVPEVARLADSIEQAIGPAADTQSP